VPTYQYTCTDCGEPVEALQKFTDEPLTVCAVCGGKLRKVFSAVGIVFKGSGFYRTDSRKGSSATDPAGKDKPSGESSAASKDSAASNGSAGQKSDKKADTASTPAKSSSSEKVA
jgi:putative FmdB family regulatory protein